MTKYIVDECAGQVLCNEITCSMCHFSKDGLCLFEMYIKSQPVYEERPHGEWICCEDHLPEKDDDYLVTYLMRGIPVVGKSWFNTKCGFIYDNVIAWQPLPKPCTELK